VHAHVGCIYNEQVIHLVDPPFNFAVENERDEQRLNVNFGNVELGSDGGDFDACIRLDGFDEHLGADVFEQILDVVADKQILHDLLLVLLEDLFEVFDFVVLIGHHQVVHCCAMWQVNILKSQLQSDFI